MRLRTAPSRSPARRALWVLPLLFLAPLDSARAQRLRDRDKPVNHPVQCPYCCGEPERMAAAGIESHGGFEFAMTDTAGVDEYLATNDIRWIETVHFEIGFALGRIKVTQDEKEKVRAELARLAEVLPEVPEKPRYLDPWLRTHLYAQRAEDLWNETLELFDVEEEDFPGPDYPGWDGTGKYMGQGPYLGQRGKYEVLILPSEAASADFLRWQFGVITKLTQRYNVVERDSLITVIHTQQGGLRVDEALHGHFAFNQTHQFFNGYKHYSYQGPIWLREGLAHYMERRINPEFNTFDSSEGAVADMTHKSDWQPPTLELVRDGEAPTMAQLMSLRDFNGLELPHHYTTWSMIDYLQREHPGFLAKLLDGVNGMTDEQNYDDGAGLPAVHRDLFRDELGMTYGQFDRAWREWVEASYRAIPQ